MRETLNNKKIEDLLDSQLPEGSVYKILKEAKEFILRNQDKPGKTHELIDKLNKIPRELHFSGDIKYEEGEQHIDFFPTIPISKPKESKRHNLLYKIAKIVEYNDSLLDMESWHMDIEDLDGDAQDSINDQHPCGTVHCIAGWACALDKYANDLEIRYGTSIAGKVCLPQESHKYFYYTEVCYIENIDQPEEAKDYLMEYIQRYESGEFDHILKEENNDD